MQDGLKSWIGLRDATCPGQWGWISYIGDNCGDPACQDDQLGFSMWSAGEPSGDGHCVEANFGTPGEGRWNDVPCDDRNESRYFICETNGTPCRL